MSNTYTKEKDARIQVKLRDVDDFSRKTTLEDIAIELGSSFSAMLLAEMKQMIKESKTTES